MTMTQQILKVGTQYEALATNIITNRLTVAGPPCNNSIHSNQKQEHQLGMEQLNIDST